MNVLHVQINMFRIVKLSSFYDEHSAKRHDENNSYCYTIDNIYIDRHQNIY